MLLRSCCKTFSERRKPLAAQSMASRASHSERRSSWKSFSRWRREARIPHRFGGFRGAHLTSIVSPRKGTAHGTPDFLSHDTDRWAFYLLSRSRPERRADAFALTRSPFFVADV